MHSDMTFRIAALSPYDLKVIDSVFRAELRKRSLSRRSEEAEQLAARLISLYQAGRRDAHELSAAVADAKPASSSVVSSQQEQSGSPC